MKKSVHQTGGSFFYLTHFFLSVIINLFFKTSNLYVFVFQNKFIDI